MVRFFTPGWVLRHVLVVVVAIGCFGMAYWQWTRALDGSLLSWGYSFQWPLFGLAAVALWARELSIELKQARGESVESDDPPLVSPFDRGEAVGTRGVEPTDSRSDATTVDSDSAADAYNHYLAWLTANPNQRPSQYPGTAP